MFRQNIFITCLPKLSFIRNFEVFKEWLDFAKEFNDCDMNIYSGELGLYEFLNVILFVKFKPKRVGIFIRL